MKIMAWLLAVKVFPTLDQRLSNFSIHRSYTSFASTVPEIIQPVGLPKERREYLFNQIRPFVPERGKDILCPNKRSRSNSN